MLKFYLRLRPVHPLLNTSYRYYYKPSIFMQIIKIVRTLTFLLLPFASFSQSSYLPLGSKDYKLLDRLEIKTGNPNLNYSTVKPYNRRLVTKEVENIDSLYTLAGDSSNVNLTEIDKYNI